MRATTFHLSIAGVLAMLTPIASSQSPWKVGTRAPHVHLPDIATGESVDLAQFRGKKVLIAEFASW